LEYDWRDVRLACILGVLSPGEGMPDVGSSIVKLDVFLREEGPPPGRGGKK
jgi:hypothetical protein